MNREEFMKTCSGSGYASKKVVLKYINLTDKDEFNTDDLIEVYRLNEKRLNINDPMFINRDGYKSTKKYKRSEGFGNDRI